MAKNIEYDACIVGSDIAGMCTAIKLNQQGKRTLIIEEQDVLGGLYRPLQYLEQEFSSHLLFLPDAPEAKNALSLLEEFLPDLSYETKELGPITFQNGQSQPFLGFAELNPEAIDLYSYFAHSNYYQLSLSTAEIVARLRELYEGETLLQSKVTDINFSEPIELILNGSQSIKTKCLYYFDSPKRLSDLLFTEGHKVTKSANQKLGKSELWTSVSLIYHHPQKLTDSQAMHVLYGSKAIPCLGRWHEENNQVFSHWMTFVPGELSTDSEHIGLAVKEIKRQIKRMYPNFYEQMNREFIYVNSEAYGHVPGNIVEAGHLPQEERLVVGSRYFSQFEGFLGDMNSLADWTLFNSKIEPSEANEPTLTI